MALSSGLPEAQNRFSDHLWMPAHRLQLRGQLRHCRRNLRRTVFPLSLREYRRTV